MELYRWALSTTPVKTTLGRRIKLLRTIAGVHGYVLADRLGVSSSYLSLIERDRRMPTETQLTTIGEFFSIAPSELLAGG